MVQLDVCLLRNEVATQKERENCQGDRDRLQKLVHHFLRDAMVTAGRVFPMWAVRHLFWHTRSQNELWADMYILQSMPEYTTAVWKPLSYTCLVIPSVHIGNTRSLYVIPYIFPCYLFIKSHNSGSVSEFLDLLYLLTSFMFILCLAFSPPLLLSLFFFELHSAYSRAYNLTPPSSLTLSLHPLAKLPFRSRGNPLISQTQLPRLHLGWGGGWCGLKGRSLMGHKAFQMIVDFVFTNSPCFPSTLRMGSG